jgi:uncharacterized membrane protein YecN with MAPEG domain
MMRSLLALARPDRLLRFGWQTQEYVMYTDAPYTVIQRAMHIHPTVSELIPTMLGELKPLE